MGALLASIAAVAPAPAPAARQSTPAAPGDAVVRALEQQLKSLQRQLDEINAARDDATRRRLMQQHWEGMQDYIGKMHDQWGMGPPWMAGRPWARMGPGMMGDGGPWWPLPAGMTPEQYVQQMQSHLARMRDQLNKIAQASDPQQRQSLMQAHWQATYQQMQTMRGLGWMWHGGPMMGHMPGGMRHGGMMGGAPVESTSPLPDAGSGGAKLVSKYCAQCHAAPQPTLHTATEWTRVSNRMRIHMSNSYPGIQTPTEQEMGAILTYMQKYGAHQK
jgi:hypothetical protein